MADAWGGSWGSSWGGSWGASSTPAPVVPWLNNGPWTRKKRHWRWWAEEEKTDLRKVVKAEVTNAIQQGLLVELTRAGVRAYTEQAVERLVPEMSDKAVKEITARITASLHRVIAQQRQDEEDEEALLLSS